jgi:hypothetical protein
MVIDRSNYETWIIDWLDGNLDDIQARELLSFLDENPDLREEMEDISSICLPKSVNSFQQKELLKKTIADLPDSQFEYLCIAHLEKDLNSSQERELRSITGLIPGRRRLFELFQKTVLRPPELAYDNKERLKRKTTGQMILRLSIISMSTAATIALIIMAYMQINMYMSNNKMAVSEQSGPDSLIIYSVPPVESVNEVALKIVDERDREKEAKEETIRGGEKILTDIISEQRREASASPFIREDLERDPIIKVPLPSVAEIVQGKGEYHLIEYKSQIIVLSGDEERSRLSKFIAGKFRDLILKEEKVSTIPLKGYEIAEGGIKGLNMLLGWEMALEKTNNEHGELQSLYFSSKMLKFNTPVKIEEPVP